MMKKIFASLIIAATLAACGGGSSGEKVSLPSIIPEAQAQTTTPAEVVQIHCIIRPNSAGVWYVQNDIDHSPSGCSIYLEQTAEFVRVYFTRTFTHAGTVQVTSDDDFNVKVQGFAALGRNSTTIQVFANGQRINPADIYKHTPDTGGGNFWLNASMMNK